MVPDEIERAYREWLWSTHQPAHSRRTAERNAAFLTPHLSKGMRLLDVGCGSGSITRGFVELVAPGEAVGIDLSQEAIAVAGGSAKENLRFEVADAMALPFDDGSFDAVFCHAVLQHLESPIDGLLEMRRVLKPGGVIGVADADFDGSVLAPTNERLERGNEILAQARRHPRIGKQLRGLLHDAGFARIVGTATAGTRGVAQAIQMDGEFWARYFVAEPFLAWVEAQGWATREEMGEISTAWRAWGNDPGAFSAAFWCEAVGWAE